MKNKLIISLLLFIACTSSLKSMNKKTQEIVVAPLPELPYEIVDEILFKELLSTFTRQTPPSEAKKLINAVRLVNKELCNFIKDPKTVCDIVNRMSQGSNQHIVAKKIGTSEAVRYAKENTILSNHLFRMKNEVMRKKLSRFTFTDPAFLPNKKPVLFRIKGNLAKVKILFNFGANPNVKHSGKTFLQVAIEEYNNKLAKTILRQNPKNKCILPAIMADNMPILEIILQRNDLSPTELNDGLHLAVNNIHMKSIELLLAAGADPNLHLYASVSRLLEAQFGYVQRDPAPLFNVVHTLCAHGAWNENAWHIVQAISEKAAGKENLLCTLHMGKRIAERNEKI